MELFDFLAFLVKIALCLLGLFVVIIAFFDLQNWYEGKKHENQKKLIANQRALAQQRYFESQMPRIIEAVNLLEEAQNRIPVLASQEVSRYGISSTHLVAYRMEDQLALVIKGCRIKFGDYVTDQALHNVGLGRYTSSGFYLSQF